MKNITEIVQKTADLARLELSNAEVETFSQQIGNILNYVEKLQKVNTDGVEPIVTPTPMECYLRADEVRPSTGAAIVAASAENLYDNYKVPQVIAGKS